VQDRHVIAVYCRFRDEDKISSRGNISQMFPEHVMNRIKKAKEVYTRIVDSHADSQYTKIVFFGEKSIDPLKQYAQSLGLPEQKVHLVNCKDIATMVKKIWNMVRNEESAPRIYFVVSNWQWMYLDQLITLKDERFRFYFEGAVDERHPDEIEMDKRMEKVARIELKQGKLSGILDMVGGSVSQNLKG
jgi:hypothetical protein